MSLPPREAPFEANPRRSKPSSAAPMAAVEVLPAACDAAISIAETLQALDMGSQAEIPSLPETQHSNSSHVEHGQVLDANARVYCASNTYGTSVYYCGGYNAPSTGWLDEHGGNIGYDAGRIYPVYGEDGSVLYYASSYAFFQHCHQPSFCHQPPPAFIPGPAAGGHAYGPQALPFPSPVYQHPVSQGVHYYSPPSFGSKKRFSKPGHRKSVPGSGSHAVPPKYGYHGMLSPPLNGPYSWGGPAMPRNYHGRDGYAFHDGARAYNSTNPAVPARDLAYDASGGIQTNALQSMPALSKHSQSIKQEPPRNSMPEPCPKIAQALPKPVCNDSGRPVNDDSGSKSEKTSPVSASIPGSENTKQECNIRLAQLKVYESRTDEPADKLGNGSQWHQPTKCNIEHTATEQSDCAVYPTSSEQYNEESFQTRYDDAKFFIIKSYSEDDVHKSIKYAVWSSTPNGNRRLDAAYREAQASAQPFPVFLLFSVNTSGQFCGLAEMAGRVDYDRSMDFWLQGKWSGCFPVKWRIVKDVPNSQLRHIILSNNENKPVTHSRDTQEVKLEQGTEMLVIFKSFPLKTSILDDFQFYDDRQKFLEEWKSRQRAPCQAVKKSDQKASREKPCESCKEAHEGEDREKPGEARENASDVSSGNTDEAEQSDDKRTDSKPDSSRGESETGNVNYKRALMESAKGTSNVVQ